MFLSLKNVLENMINTCSLGRHVVTLLTYSSFRDINLVILFRVMILSREHARL